MQARELSLGLLTRVDISGTIRRDFSDEQQLIHFTLGGGLLTLDEGGVYYERRAKMFRTRDRREMRERQNRVFNYCALEQSSIRGNMSSKSEKSYFGIFNFESRAMYQSFKLTTK